MAYSPTKSRKARRADTLSMVVGMASCALAAIGLLYVANTIAAPSYSLIGDLRGEQSVLDYNMSASDCLDAMASKRALWGSDVTFSCEREG